MQVEEETEEIDLKKENALNQAKWSNKMQPIAEGVIQTINAEGTMLDKKELLILLLLH